MSADEQRRVLVGKIVGVSGTAGAIKLESWTEPRMQIFKYQPWILKSAQTEREIAGCRGREQGKGMVAALPGIDDRDQAASLIGTEIWVLRSALPKPKPGEYYWADLEGMDVFTVDGQSLGQVSHLFATGANDVLVAQDGERQRMVPFVLEQYVKQVDLDARRIVVDWDPDF
ncbi:16S rRNA processing protein RimM [Tahibacter aquaticus]|uniref:Ribosome maturation factor RimM n=1 Tax=Tahibacter aquaticus TaxID=520092 RepID=A0A4R6Z297_9GAMM|nr:ribosome maturation factor RimM [Tahibacter aquaticus]TDR45725.1 16S rRNA processing protein RimM [Tahibacter aquaticus]